MDKFCLSNFFSVGVEFCYCGKEIHEYGTLKIQSKMIRNQVSVRAIISSKTKKICGLEANEIVKSYSIIDDLTKSKLVDPMRNSGPQIQNLGIFVKEIEQWNVILMREFGYNGSM